MNAPTVWPDKARHKKWQCIVRLLALAKKVVCREVMNELKVVQIALTNLYEGTITFETKVGKRFSAFSWGQHLEINQTYKVTFSSLDYPLDWKVIFSENREYKKTLEATNQDWSYLAYGQILSINPVITDFGDLILEVGNWTNDERVIGEFIYWKIERLDVLDVKP